MQTGQIHDKGQNPIAISISEIIILPTVFVHGESFDSFLRLLCSFLPGISVTTPSSSDVNWKQDEKKKNL